MDERLRIDELILKHLDQAATPDEAADLDHALAADDATADDFAEAARLDALLADHFGQRHRTLEIASLLDARQPEPTTPTRRRPALRWAAVAAAALVAVGAGVLGWLAYQARTDRASARGRHTVVSGRVLVHGQPTQVVRVGVRMLVDGTQPALLRLADGSHTTLQPHTQVVLRAPAEGIRQAVELLEGEGRFQVAKGLGRFRVDTLLGSVTALGTDFSVAFRPVRHAEAATSRSFRTLKVAVAEGAVEVEFCGRSCTLAAGAHRTFSAGVRVDSACAPPVPQKAAAPAPSVGVLPLPATPQRRVASKRPPAPPTVVVKLKSGKPRDWATDPNDIRNLLLWMQTKLNVAFTYEEKTLADVDLDARRLPMLYRTDHHAFAFTPAERKRLRDYVLKGGFMVFDACCGRKAFADSVRREMAEMFPERPLRTLPPDHPLYHCAYDTPCVAYTPAAGIGGLSQPPLEGIDVGCRTAVVFSAYDLSCGWDMHTHTTCAGVQAEHALKLGANLVAYAMATKAMGASLAESRVYVDKGPPTADRFRIGHVVHGGQWNPDPAGLSMLLDAVRSTTVLKVSFATRPLHLDTKALASHPFIYMTGHGDFVLSKDEVAALRAYLKAGGFLLADACCGRKAFDTAFRRELAKTLPGARLQRLEPNHPVYSIHHKIGTVRYTQAAVTRDRAMSPGPPMLEGLCVSKGQLAVVYSPLDLGCGWELKPNPFGVGYESRDAIRLGVNIVVYAVSH